VEELARLECARDAGAAEDVDGVSWRQGILPIEDDAGEKKQCDGARQRQQQKQPAGPTTNSRGGQGRVGLGVDETDVGRARTFRRIFVHELHPLTFA
jgi:hypothetical protein